MRFHTCFIIRLLPIMSFACGCCDSSSSILDWVASLRTFSRRHLKSNGFVRKSAAPSLNASTTEATSPYALIIMTEISGLVLFISLKTCRPSVSGIRRSTMARKGDSSFAISMPSFAEVVAITEKSSLKIWDRTLFIPLSSSIIKTCGCFVAISFQMC